jgi:hypothetical protein
MGGSSSSEKGAEDHSESGGVETKRTVCTTITGGKSRKNRKHRKHCKHCKHHKHTHSKSK